MKPGKTLATIELPGDVLTWDGFALRRGITLILTSDYRGVVLRGAYRELAGANRDKIDAFMREQGVDMSHPRYDVEILAGIKPRAS